MTIEMVEIPYTIKVGFTQEIHADFVSRMIMKFEKTNYSHSLILFEDVDFREKVFHSIGKGVLVDPEQEYLKTHKIVKLFEIPMSTTREGFGMYVRGRTLSKIEYSQGQYLNQVARLLGMSMKLVHNDGAKTICSEETLMALALSKLGSTGLLDADMVSPKMLCLFLEGEARAGRCREIEVAA